MKAKVILRAAAGAFAAILHSQAQQVYSVNAVGYVQQYVPANGLNIISIPLNGTSNNLNTTLRLPDGFDGTTIYRFGMPIQNYRDPISWIEGYGWYSATDPDPSVNPGEGIWVHNIAPTRLNLTFIGEVPVGTFNVPLPGGNNLKLLASTVPKDVKLSELCAEDGDTVYIWDPENQRYKDPVQYIPAFGWFSANPDDPGPAGYTIPPATGFWYQGAGAACVWSQTFSVN